MLFDKVLTFFDKFSKKKKAKSDAKTKYDDTKYLVKRMIKNYVRPHRKQFFFAVFLMVIVAGTTAAHAWIMKPAVDLMFENNNPKLFILIPAAIALITIIKGFSQYFQVLSMQVVTLKITTTLRMNLYSHFIYSDISTYNQSSSGTMISKMTHNVGMVVAAINVMLTGLIKQLLTIIFLIIVMFYVNLDLALISFVGIPMAVLPIYLVGKKLRNLSLKSNAGMEKFTSQMDDTLKSSKLVKSYNAEEYEIKRMNIICQELLKLSKKISKISLISSPFTESMGGIAVAFVVWYGGTQVAAGHTTPGDFFAFFFAMISAYKPMKSLASMNSTFQLGLAGAKSIFMIIDEKPQIFDKLKAKELKKVKGKITLENVRFNYIKSKTALDGLNLNIEPGQKVALVGSSGAGKSTVMSLLLRFYDPLDGKILLDGHDLRDLKLKSIRSSMAFVNQEVQLFDDTIKENIRYCKLDATDEEIIKAARMAEAHDFITETQNGYDTMIGQNGIKLSGGQRQRISIARAILYNAPILLLDEATSSLDTESEAKIKIALDHLMEGKTSIVIAHRLSTVINADKIYVMAKGKVIEEGTHKELLKKGGEYASLYSKQFD